MASQEHHEFANQLDEPDIDPVFFTARFDQAACEKASLPAALCAAAYAPQSWAFDVAAGIADPVAWMGEEQFRDDRDALARSLMIAERCKPLEASDLGIAPERLGGELARGVFRNGDLAQALIATADNGHGGRELHLCIRGTDFANNVHPWIAKFQGLVGYFAWTYPRIEKHANHFKELARAASSYASDPAHGIERVVISGHSLGGAAAQSLLSSFTDCKAPARAVTFGSPGTGSGWLAPFKAILREARNQTRDSLDSAASGLELAGEIAPLGKGAMSAFASLMRTCARAIEPALPKDFAAGRPEQLHFRHPNDPIPKLGSLLYSVGDTPRIAMSGREFDLAQDGKDLVAKGIKAHSSTRYFDSIQTMLFKNTDEVEVWKDPSFEMAQWSKAKVGALRLEMSIPAESASQAIAAARKTTLAKLSSSNPNDPAIERLQALPEPSVLPEKIKKNRQMRRMQTALTTNGLFSSGLKSSP